MNEVIGNLLTGNLIGAIASIFHKPPQEHIREAAKAILEGKDVDENMAKLQGELQKPGGDPKKMEEVSGLMQDMASGKSDQTSTMEQILAIVSPGDAKKMGIPESGKRMKSDSIQF